MKKTSITLLFALSSLLFAGLAHAQTESEAQAPKSKLITFGEGDEVVGTLKKPNGDSIVGERHDRLKSLVSVRSDFIDKVVLSVDEL